MMPLHYNRTAVVDGTASVHHRLAFMMRRFMDCRTVMGRAALVHHGLRLVMLCAPVHTGTLLFGNVLMNCRSVMGNVRDCFDAWPVLPDGRNCFYVPGGPAVSVRDAVRRHDGPAPLQKLPSGKRY